MKMVGLRVASMAHSAVLRLDNELADAKAVSMADEKADAVVVVMVFTWVEKSVDLWAAGKVFGSVRCTSWKKVGRPDGFIVGFQEGFPVEKV